MRTHEITDRDAFVASSYPRHKASKVKTILPCGNTVVAEQSEVHPTHWFITIFDGEQARCSLGLKVTPSNANAVYNLLRKLVHQTPGVEEKA